MNKNNNGNNLKGKMNKEKKTSLRSTSIGGEIRPTAFPSKGGGRGGGVVSLWEGEYKEPPGLVVGGEGVPCGDSVGEES